MIKPTVPTLPRLRNVQTVAFTVRLSANCTWGFRPFVVAATHIIHKRPPDVLAFGLWSHGFPNCVGIRNFLASVQSKRFRCRLARRIWAMQTLLSLAHTRGYQGATTIKAASARQFLCTTTQRASLLKRITTIIITMRQRRRRRDPSSLSRATSSQRLTASL